MNNMSLEEKKDIVRIVNDIILNHEQGYIVTYQDINILIKLLGGVPSVSVDTQSTSVLCYLNALLIRALLS